LNSLIVAAWIRFVKPALLQPDDGLTGR
jgi:hypothetical protein